MHLAIAGNIGSGKTTLTTLLAKHYRYTPHFEQVDDNPYLNDFYKDMTRWSFNLQIYFLKSRFAQLIEMKKKGKPIIAFENPRHNTQPDIPDEEEGVDIGQETAQAYAAKIAQAKTILWNGPMGIFEDPRFSQGTFAVADAVAKATSQGGAKSIIGGGDSVKALNQSGLGDQVTFMSTGGGASLEFLEGKELPGVAALGNR